MPAAEFAQEKVCVAARVRDVFEDGLSARLARVVDDHVAEAQHALEEGRACRHVLNVSQGDVARRLRSTSTSRIRIWVVSKTRT